jgi:glycine cleavage system T protein
METQKTALYECHLRLLERTRLVDFAGYWMPLWYSSIRQEHQAVRERAGLFDCTHMGVWEITGADARPFLDAIVTNNISTLERGIARYAYILDESGSVLDDIIVYGLDKDKFMVVVNAANNEKIGAYFFAASARLQTYDLCLEPKIRNMRDEREDGDLWVDIALQGPASRKILQRLFESEADREALESLKPLRFFPAAIKGITLIVSRTGYTGASIGYELFVSPSRAGDIWQTILDEGNSFGVAPCGLGSRDSLRIEAGLPLYGHELAGDWNISPFEAGYGWAVKLEKPFFVGQEAMRANAETHTMQVQRLQLPGRSGVRPVRPHDAVLNSQNRCLGWILSCTKIDNTQIALAYVKKRETAVGNSVGIYYIARNERHIQQGKKQEVRLDETVLPDIRGAIVERTAKF